jgi:hypothetical protein
MNKILLIFLFGIFIIFMINNKTIIENFTIKKCTQSSCPDYCKSRNSAWGGYYVPNNNSCQCYLNQNKNNPIKSYSCN